MLKKVATKVAWVGRTVSMMLGLALMLRLVFGVASMALGANGSNFILGTINNTATALTKLTANVQGVGMQVQNTNPGTDDTALSLSVQQGEAPLRVNSNTKVTNLNADKLDGQEASDLAEPRGYAHVKDEGGVDTVYPSKGINDVVIPTGETSLYCFDLAFTPKTAVGAPFLFNNAVVATATPPNGALSSACPEGFRDAAVQIYSAEPGNPEEVEPPINFQIVFE